MVQEVVVATLMKNWDDAGVRVGRTGHGDGAALVGKAVVGFVLDGAWVAFSSIFMFMPPPWIMNPLITRWKMVLA